MSGKKNKRQNPEGDAHPKVTSMQDMYLSPKRQCTAMSKASGQQCQRYAMRGLRVCVMHGGATRQARAKAAERIQQASGYAADLLVELMANPDIDVKTRTQIAQDLLDRSGVSTKTIMELQPKAMSAFDRAVLSSYVDEDGNPAFVDDGEGGMKAVTPGGGLSTDIVVIEDDYDDPNIWDAEVVIEDEDDRDPALTPREDYDAPPMNRHDRAMAREVERNHSRRARPGDMTNEQRARAEHDLMADQRHAEHLAEQAEIARDREAMLLAKMNGTWNGSSRGEAMREAAKKTTGKRRARVTDGGMGQS